MNAKQKGARASKMTKMNLELRETLWPNLKSGALWSRQRNDGYTTMPRTMPQIMQIMDSLANGKPVSQTYLGFWCRVFDESLIEIKNERELAYEAGFSGERAVTTWHSRVKVLVDMGFIDAKPGPAGKYNYVLIFNPYEVIKMLHIARKIPEQLYIALFRRTQEVGASDDLK